MKKNLLLVFLLFTLFISLRTYAGSIVVKGHVLYTTGSPVINGEVKIAGYVASSTSSCTEVVAITDANGFYSKELSCTGDIRRTRITIKNCDGQILVQEKEVPASKVIEANFTVCKPSPSVTCSAKFNAEPVPSTSTIPPFAYQFNSSASEVTTGDHIIHRTWDFHDGSPLVNDRVDPVHTFPHAGTYEVCLIIKTDKGCESKICKNVVVPPVTPVTCSAKFNAEHVPATSTLPPFSYQFNSSPSEVSTGDHIIHRTWDFHDGSPLVNDRVDPAHTFTHAGTYEVCLTIKTDKGCESKMCKNVVVPPVNVVTCTAKFNAEPVPSSSTLPPFSYKFNSSPSEVTTGDHIIHRTWDFHDGSPLVNDRVDPLHTFSHGGTYEVCLIIKTDKGCESRICKTILVPPSTSVTCTAKFDFEKVSLNKFRFHGNMSMLAANDYITGRKWDFHDGTTSTEVSPLHEFVKPGNYEVCLTIKTAKGCESHYCSLVKVEEMPMSVNDYVKIISLYPSPVKENLKAVVYSKANNITGSISIINLYGSVQYTKQLVLVQGYNSFIIPTFSLMPGSYFFKVTTQFGTLSKPFYKF